MTGNDITGTYSPTIAATETTPVYLILLHLLRLLVGKDLLMVIVQHNTVTFNLDIDRCRQCMYRW